MASYSDFVNRNKKIQKKDREKNTEPYLRRDTILKGLALGRFYLPGNELKPEAENNQKLSNIEAGMAGIASGALKVPEGIISLGAELIDLGFDTRTASEIEMFFDKLNPFEESANERAIGRLTEALVQIGVPGTVGAKTATKLATKALNAKKAGNLLNPASSNIKKGLDKTRRLNELTGRQKFGAIVLGGAAGETLVSDVEKIGTFGDVFEKGPTQLDRKEFDDPSEDAERKILNRLKFGSESLALTPFVYGAGKLMGALAKQGKHLAYSDSAIERAVDKFASVFRFRGAKPVEQAVAKETESTRKMADLNFSM